MPEAARLIGGRYRLDSVIGAGAAGRVWRAHDELLDRTVAAKELRLPWGVEDGGDELTARAVAEARSSARLQHPHIVRIFDVVTDDRVPWIVMELVDGRSLAQLVRTSGPLSPPHVAEIGLSILDALGAAHRAGVLHRDVKPSNVLIARDGAALLTDFSIARAVNPGTVTDSGVFLGTPGYAAPERILHSTIGPEADLFGLGATLYFAVEGRGAFDADDPLAGAVAAAVKPHPQPERAGALTDLINGLLEKDPRNRLTAEPARAGLPTAAGKETPAPTVVAHVATAEIKVDRTGGIQAAPFDATSEPDTQEPPVDAAPHWRGDAAERASEGFPIGRAAVDTAGEPAEPPVAEPQRRGSRTATIAAAVVLALLLVSAAIAQAASGRSASGERAGTRTTPVVSSAATGAVSAVADAPGASVGASPSPGPHATGPAVVVPTATSAAPSVVPSCEVVPSPCPSGLTLHDARITKFGCGGGSGGDDFAAEVTLSAGWYTSPQVEQVDLIVDLQGIQFVVSPGAYGPVTINANSSMLLTRGGHTRSDVPLEFFFRLASQPSVQSNRMFHAAC